MGRGAVPGPLKLKCMHAVGEDSGALTEGTPAGQLTLKWARADAVPGLSTQCSARTADVEEVQAGLSEFSVQKALCPDR